MLSYRVWEHGAPSTMKIDKLDSLRPGPDEIVIGVKAVGINYPDVLVISGKYQVLPPKPFTPGKDLAGIVKSVGVNVKGFKAGDRVMSQVENGAFAEETVVRPDQTYIIPDEMPYTSAAAMGLVYQTAHFALLERAQYKKGETVLVGGAAGGVGLAAVQIAKGLGARVLACVRSKEEADLVQQSGADVFIDLAKPDLKESLRAQVFEATGGKGADVVLDPLGGDFFPAALRAMAWCGRLCVIGFAAGDIPTVKVNYLLVKNISISGLQWSDYRDRTPEIVHAAQQEIFELWRAGAVKPSIMQEFPFAKLPVALDMVSEGKVRGKAVVVVGDAK